MSSEVERELRILEILERNPETTQANLANQLGVAVGSVNWYLKRLIRKGYIKVTQLQRRRLKYFVTPAGLALKTQLTAKYMEASLKVYRELRQAARETLVQVRQAGYTAVISDDRNEAMEIFRLTCLEENVDIRMNPASSVPLIKVEGKKFVVKWPMEHRSHLANEISDQPHKGDQIE